MTQREFDQLVRERQEKTLKTLTAKAFEYAPGPDDRLIQFKKIAAFRNTCSEDVLGGFIVKHVSALFDYIDMLTAGEEVPAEWWEEKIGDIVNYLHLLDALLVERRGKTESSAAFLFDGKKDK
jgi:hypothetical protein